MKKALALILCMLMLAVFAPASLAELADTTQTAPVKVRQYGEEDTLVSDSDGLVGNIAYPVGSIEDIDTAILTWASITMQQWRKDTETATPDKDGIKGTLTVDYESHEHGGRFVGIEEFGTYQTNGATEVGYVLYTYNYDLLASKPLTLLDVVSEEHLDAVIALVEKGIAEQGITLTNAAAALTKDDMQTFVIRDDGIGWLFTSKTGIVGVLLSYDVVGQYLCMNDAPEPAPTPEPTPEPTPTIEQTAVCLHDGCHIRAQPDQKSALIDTINANTVLQVVKANVTNGWHELWYNNQIAYIAASLVKLEKQVVKTITGYVTSNTLHVRSGPDTKHTILGTLKYQDKVDILQENVRPHWHKILYNDQVAYAYADLIAVSNTPVASPDPSKPTPAPGPKEIKPKLVPFNTIKWTELGNCTTNGVIVRSRESTRSDYYGKLHTGMQVNVIEYGKTWCKVYVPESSTNGYIGYVHTKYFTFSTPEVAPAQQANPKTIIGID